MRISDWSSDVCSSDLQVDPFDALSRPGIGLLRAQWGRTYDRRMPDGRIEHPRPHHVDGEDGAAVDFGWYVEALLRAPDQFPILRIAQRRSEEHTSELQSLMRISYAVLCLKKKKYT